MQWTGWWNTESNRGADMLCRKVYELGSGDVERKREKEKRKTRKEDFEIFVEAVSGRQKNKSPGNDLERI